MQSSLGFSLGPFEEEERAEPAKAVVQYQGDTRKSEQQAARETDSHPEKN
jgi:hypothetical protein